MPWLILLDRHPVDVESGDELLVMELGQYNSERQVTTTLQEVRKALRDEEFMRELTPNERVRWLRKALPFIDKGSTVAANAVTIATIGF